MLLVLLLTQLSLFNIPTITKCTILKLYENIGPITSVIYLNKVSSSSSSWYKKISARFAISFNCCRPSCVQLTAVM